MWFFFLNIEPGCKGSPSKKATLTEKYISSSFASLPDTVKSSLIETLKLVVTAADRHGKGKLFYQETMAILDS